MEFNLRRSCALLFILGAGFCGSCEKHHVGELPEHGEHAPTANDQAQPTVSSPASSVVSPTPAEFFPEK